MRVFAILFLLILSACSLFDNEQNLKEAEVLAVANDSFLNVLNKTNSDVYFIVVETKTSHVIDIAITCNDPEFALKPKQSGQISYSDILGWKEDAKSVWFYWTDCNGSSYSRTITL